MLPLNTLVKNRNFYFRKNQWGDAWPLLRLTVGLVGNYDQVNVGQEFARKICNLFVFLMLLYCVLVVGWFRGTKLHEVDANAVVSNRITMYVTDGFANLEELLVLLNCCLCPGCHTEHRWSNKHVPRLLTYPHVCRRRPKFRSPWVFLCSNSVVGVRVTHS